MAKKNRISVNNAAGIFFFIAAVAATYCGITLASDVVETIIFYGTAAFSVFFAIIYGKWYTLKETGIQHRFFGICYRFTPWSEIKDVMRVYQQTGERYAPLTLMFTTKRGNVYRPDETGYVPYPQKKRFLKEWLLQGKMFMIYCAPKKWGPEVVRFVEEHYGPLDYDFVVGRSSSASGWYMRSPQIPENSFLILYRILRRMSRTERAMLQGGARRTGFSPQTML